MQDEGPARGPLDALGEKLTLNYFARHPEIAIRGNRAVADRPRLGTFGARAEGRWRAVLLEAATELERFDLGHAPRVQTRLKRLEDWVQAQQLLLGSGAQATSDPASYSLRAIRVLRAVLESDRHGTDERAARVASVLSELPAYFDDARMSLADPAPPWIDLALESLEDLRDLVTALDPDAARRFLRGNPGKASPIEAVVKFRRWLLGIRASAGGDAARMKGRDWERLLGLVSGRAVQASKLKARCLRGMIDLRKESVDVRELRDDPQAFTARAWTASSNAFKLGQAAKLLQIRLVPRSLEFLTEQSLRTEIDLVSTRFQDAKSSRVLLGLPHPGWSVQRTNARGRALNKLHLTALGVRHGLAGEALFDRIRAADEDLLGVLPEARLLREGIGLFALNWVQRVDWVENSMRANAELMREFARVRTLEAMRLVTSLELHAEGLSLEEAALAMHRRTGMDLQLARLEALASQRDPLRGVGYLGLLELLDLEQRLAGSHGPRWSLTGTLKLIFENTGLRPADLPIVRVEPEDAGR